MFAEIRREYLNAENPALPFVICTVGETANQGPVNRPQGFAHHHILWVRGGEGIFWVGGERRALTSGMGLFCRRDVAHAYERQGSGPLHTRWVTFLGGEGALDYYAVPEFFFFQADAALVSAAARLDEACQGGSTPLSRSAVGYQFLADWLRQEFEPAVSPAARIRQYLEDHFAEPLTLDEIGAQVRMNRYALCRYYLRDQGITVMEQLKKIRIAKAKQFLRYASWPIEEVGRLCGYNSPSYFGKQFREETGRTPRAYREQHNG